MYFRLIRNPIWNTGRPAAVLLGCWASLFILSGCAMIMSSATSDMMHSLSDTILDNDDLAMVESGAPAYLLMIDSLISKDPDNQKMLSTAALLYSAYADVFVKDAGRSKKMSAKAFAYARKALCLDEKSACSVQEMDFQTFEETLSRMEKSRIDTLFALGNAWAGWIIANKKDMNAVADLSKVEAIMTRITQLDDGYRQGAPYLYLGSLASFLPPALGGRSEQGKAYFEKAIQLSQGRNLSAKVLYARHYARMTFNRPLHDRLLKEVINADPHAKGYTLVNTWAQQQARELLKTADDYF